MADHTADNTTDNMTGAIATELTFHYLDGRNESFTICVMTDGSADTENGLNRLHGHIRELMRQERWVLHLPDKTVIINMNTVVKVEIQPPLSSRVEHDLIVAKPALMALPLMLDSDI